MAGWRGWGVWALWAGLMLVGGVAACGGGDGGEGQDVAPLDFAADPGVADMAGDPGAPDAPAPDTAEGGANQAAPDASEAASEVAPDLPANEPPGLDALPPVTVAMGAHTTLDLAPYLSDREDPDDALVLSWSAVHVGLRDDPGHVLLVVGPGDWSGNESIEIAVTDTGGLTARAFLSVTVTEVQIPEPPVECPKTVFAYAAGVGDHDVRLSGTFNDWAGPATSQIVLADGDGDGVWTVELALSGGHYLYKFLVDGAWLADPANPNTVDDGFGGVNSVLDVPACEEGE